MLTVIMECHDQEPELAQTLSVLVAGAVEGLVSDVIVLDHGSTDGSAFVADAAGCRFYQQWDMKDVLASARGRLLLLIEPGARLGQGWVTRLRNMWRSTRRLRGSPNRVFTGCRFTVASHAAVRSSKTAF